MFDLRPAASWSTTHLADLASGEDQVRLGAAIQRAFEGDDVEPLPLESSTPTGAKSSSRARSTCPRTDGRADGRRLIVRLRDVSDREQQHVRSTRRAVASSRRSNRRRPAWRSCGVDDGRIVDANQSFAEMLRRDVDELVGLHAAASSRIPTTCAPPQPHRARLELGIVDSFRIDQRYRRRDGEYVWARTRVSAAEDDGVMLAITHIEDVTEQRRAAEQLRYAARHDELTGLPNRSYLMHILHDRLADRASSVEVAVLFVDLDHFKTINDSLGHEVGDQLLQSVADRLRPARRATTTCSPASAATSSSSCMKGEPIDVAERLRKAIQPPRADRRARAVHHRRRSATRPTTRPACRRTT